MIGGAGSLPSKMARTKSSPVIDAITCGGVTPYSICSGAGISVMASGPVYDDDRHINRRAGPPALPGMISRHEADVIRSCSAFFTRTVVIQGRRRAGHPAQGSTATRSGLGLVG